MIDVTFAKGNCVVAMFVVWDSSLVTMLSMLIAGTLSTMAFMGQDFDYKDGDFALQGYVSKPDKDMVAPGVLIVHQWGGLTEYEKMRADMIARELGYVAFAVDIYGKGNRPLGNERGQFAGKYKGDRALFRSRLNAGLAALRATPGVDKNKIAVIGYCFGGTGALELARAGADIRGAVSFHGGLEGGKPEEAKNIKAKILVCTGADDPGVPPAQVNSFMDEMKAGKIDYSIISYGNAVHAFTQPMAGNDNSKGAAYNKEADMRSWAAMTDFLHEIFAN
ncbi:MAG: dienelactone hydrolase family protein [Fimbriimonadaceae bacterium]